MASSRRRFLVKTGGLLGTLGVSSGTVGAVASARTPTVRSEGIEQKVLEHRKAGNNRQLAQMLSGYGIPYALTKKRISYNSGDMSITTASLHKGETIKEKAPSNSEDSSGRATIQEEWDENASNLARLTIKQNYSRHGIDYWYTDYSWNLNIGDWYDGDFEAASPDDAITISFEETDWEHDDNGVFCGSRTSVDEITPEGFGGLFNDPQARVGEENLKTKSLAYTYVYRMNKESAHTLFGSYVHTWSHITGSIGIGYAVVPFTFTFGIDTDHWEAAINHQVLVDGTVTEYSPT